MVGLLKDFNFELYIQNFANGNHQFFDVMNIIFPHIDLFAKTITNNDILSLLIYIGLNVIYIAVFLLLAKYIYHNSVIGLSSKDTKVKNNSTKLLNNIKSKSTLKSYIEKEFKILIRTPSFFINCIIINIIWPVFILTIHKIVLTDYGISDIQLMLIDNANEIKILLLLVISGLSILIPAMNSIASTSFSREGKHFSFMKYIPVSYKEQWLAKYLISMIISFIGINIFATIFYILIRLDILTILVLYIIRLLQVSATNLIGMYIDSIQPKLIWDDENNALRENFNTFISMSVALLIFGITCGTTYFYLYKQIHMSFLGILLILTVLSLLLNLIFVLIIKKSGYKNIIEQEET
jgi:ABC-2 type transport system permease protein